MNYLIMRESIACMLQKNSCYSILACRFGMTVYFCNVIVIHVGLALLDNAPMSIKPEDYY